MSDPIPAATPPVIAVAPPPDRAMRRLQMLVWSLLAAFLLLAIIAAIVAAALWYEQRYGSPFLRHYPLTVNFADAQGVESGDAVEMAGTRIGKVDRIRVRAGVSEVSMNIEQDVRIPRGSRFIAEPDLFSTLGHIKIVPPTVEAIGFASSSSLPPGTDPIQPNETGLTGEAGRGLPETMERINTVLAQGQRLGSRSEVLLGEVSRATNDVRTMMKDKSVQQDLRQTLGDVRTATKGAAELTGSLATLLRKTAPQSDTMFRNLTKATGEIGAVVSETHQLARASYPQVKTIIANTSKVSAATDALVSAPQTKAQVASLLADITETAHSMRSTSESLQAIATNNATVLGDPEVASDLRQSIHSLQVVSRQMEKAATNAEPLVGDSTVATDLRETLHTMKELSSTANTLLQALNKVAQKAAGGNKQSGDKDGDKKQQGSESQQGSAGESSTKSSQ